MSDLGKRPGYIVALTAISLGSILVAEATLPIMLKVAVENIPPEIGPERLELALDSLRRWHTLASFMTPILLVIKFSAIAGLLFTIIVVLNGPMSYRQAFSLVACAAMIPFLESCFVLLILRLSGTEHIYGPADLKPAIGMDLLFTDPGEPLKTLLGSLNIFQLWYIAVLVIGVAILNNFSRSKSASAVTVVWLCLTAAKAAMAALAE